ncbi:hypothetical protein NC651_033547 [Populus alba x Populus x berolinensis]|nr:hypothetical protein NC651_033547 [Populus alba x Populus x berolinensis]
MEARSCASTSSSCFFPGRKDSKCHHEAVEFACSSCLFCVSCPLSIVWCCIMLPCKIGCKAAGQARKRFTCCRHCGSEKKIYSSFSDIDDSDCRLSHHKHSSGPSTCRFVAKPLSPVIELCDEQTKFKENSDEAEKKRPNTEFVREKTHEDLFSGDDSRG